ncbi:MAG: hypothetical protein ACR2NW_07120 [Thermodesulfobacteriota bacterium]
MKYLLILTILILNCGGNDNRVSEKKSDQIYDDCYNVSEKMFKNIPKSEFNTLTVDELCDEDTSFYKGKLEKACVKACKDVFFHYKNKTK